MSIYEDAEVVREKIKKVKFVEYLGIVGNIEVWKNLRNISERKCHIISKKLERNISERKCHIISKKLESDVSV